MYCVFILCANFSKPISSGSILKFQCLSQKGSRLACPVSGPHCPPLSSFPCPVDRASCRSLVSAATTQSAALTASAEFSPCLRFLLPSHINQSVCLQAKRHFPFKNERSNRWKPPTFAWLQLLCLLDLYVFSGPL